MLIICAGMMRSGSTWLYNAVRLACAATGGRVHAGWIDDFRMDDAADFNVLKIHAPDEHWSARSAFVFTSRRDPVGIARSAKRMKWVETDEEASMVARQAIAHHAFWNPRSAYETVFEDIGVLGAFHVEALARILGVPLDRRASLQLVEQLDALEHEAGPETHHDPLNLIHKYHRSGDESRSVAFSPDVGRALLDAERDWCERWGYGGDR